MRVGDGKGFDNSKKLNIWGIDSSISNEKHFLKEVKSGDIIWFLTNYTKGRQLVGVATFLSTVKRELGPLIAVTKTNEELGWDKGDWDTEVHYEKLYLIQSLDLYPDLKHRSNVIKTTSTKTDLDFEQEYKNIVKYSKVTLSCSLK